MILFLIINFLLMSIMSILCWGYLLSPSHTKKNYGKNFNKIITLYLFYSLIFIVIELLLPESDKKSFPLSIFTFIKIIELPFITLFAILGQILYKKHKRKINFKENNKTSSFAEWKENKTDIINRLNIYKSIKILENEKKDLNKLNDANILKESFLFSQNIFCENIQQVCFILKLKYGIYDKDWRIEYIGIDGNNLKFKLILNNKKVKNLNFKKIKD